MGILLLLQLIVLLLIMIHKAPATTCTPIHKNCRASCWASKIYHLESNFEIEFRWNSFKIVVIGARFKAIYERRKIRPFSWQSGIVAMKYDFLKFTSVWKFYFETVNLRNLTFTILLGIKNNGQVPKGG